jgi:hypothetical protein
MSSVGRTSTESSCKCGIARTTPTRSSIIPRTVIISMLKAFVMRAAWLILHCSSLAWVECVYPSIFLGSSPETFSAMANALISQAAVSTMERRSSSGPAMARTRTKCGTLATCTTKVGLYGILATIYILTCGSQHLLRLSRDRPEPMHAVAHPRSPACARPPG